MIDEQKVAELAAAAHETAQTYRDMGYLNANRPAAEAKQLAIDYALAAAKAREARKALDDYLDSL